MNQSKWIVTVVKTVIKIAGSYLFPALNALPPVVELTDAAIDTISDKVSDSLSQNQKDRITIIRNAIKQHAAQIDCQHLPFLASVIGICVEDLDMFQYSFDATMAADTLSQKYLNSDRAKKVFDGFGPEELEQYRKDLPLVLESVIHEMQRQLEHDPDYQIECKKRMAQKISEQEKLGLSSLLAELSSRYKGLWTSPLFLTRSITLEKLHQVPDYQEINNYNRKHDLEEYLQKTLDFCNDTRNRMLVVLGQPGIGKSTLISYLLNRGFVARDRNFVVYKFSNFENFDWNRIAANLLQDMLRYMGRKDAAELSNSVLILDGLDEVAMSGGQIDFLNELWNSWAHSEDITRFNLIVTCRTNRIPNPEDLIANCIELCPFDPGQIDEFSRNYCQLAQKPYVPIPLKDSLEAILGIPIILYMVLALDIQVETASSRTDIYRKIFAPDEERRNTSIYYRPNYDTKHPVTGTKANEIHTFSKRIAVKMWESNPSEATIEKTDYQEIAKDILAPDQEGPLTEDQLGNLLIGQYFMEGQRGHELLFVHRSIYEYFVAVSIFDVVQEMVQGDTTPRDLYQQLEQSIQNGERCDLTPFATIMGLQRLPEYPEIQGYLLNLFDGEPAAKPEWWREFFDYFNEDGLSDAAIGRRKGGEVGVQEELNRFYNLIWFVREQLRLAKEPVPFKIWNAHSVPVCFRFQDNKDKDLSDLYLNTTVMPQSIFLKEDNLAGAYLDYANLQHANLDLTNLKGAHLEGARLEHASLNGAHLEYAHLKGAHLEHANLYGAHLEYADREGAILPEGYKINKYGRLVPRVPRRW